MRLLSHESEPLCMKTCLRSHFRWPSVSGGGPTVKAGLCRQAPPDRDLHTRLPEHIRAPHLTRDAGEADKWRGEAQEDGGGPDHAAVGSQLVLLLGVLVELRVSNIQMRDLLLLLTAAGLAAVFPCCHVQGPQKEYLLHEMQTAVA